LESLTAINVHGQLILAGGRGKVKLELYNADRTKLIGSMVNDMVIDLAKTPMLNIKGSGQSSFQNRRFSSMSFYADDKPVHTDNTVPSWMGDPDSAWTPLLVSIQSEPLDIDSMKERVSKCSSHPSV
jgi:hypothetical protein